MSNQHTKHGITYTYQKCAEPSCNNQVKRTPSQVRKGKQIYCSHACSFKSCRVPRKYKESDIEWIVKNAWKVSREEMCIKFKANKESFNKLIQRLRREGYEIPHVDRKTANRSILTETQRDWILDRFDHLSWIEMGKEMNLPPRTIKNFVDYQLLKGNIKRVLPNPNYKRPHLQLMQNKPGKSAHRDRKPPVSEAKPRERPMDRRVPTRVIDTSKCIKVVLNDKNHTILYARDEARELKLRKQYAYLEKPIGERV